MSATVCCRFGSWGLVIKLNFCSDFQHKVWSGVWSWSWDWIRNWSLIKICVELVIWTQPSGPLCLWQCFNYCDLFSIYASRFYSCVLSSISVTETVSCFPSKADRCNSLLWVLDFHYMGLRWKDKVSPFTSKAELKKKVSGQGSPAPHHHPGEQIPRFLISRSGLWWQWQWQSAVKW